MCLTTRVRVAAGAAYLGIFLAGTVAPAAAQPEILLEKSTNGQDADLPPGPPILVGDAVTWAYHVTNTGSRDLTNIVVTDDQGVTVTCPATTLSPGESMTCTGDGTAQEGQYANVGTATAELPNATPVQDTDPSHYVGIAQVAITLEKSTVGFDADTPPGPYLPVGSAVSWSYEVTNVGVEPLTDVQVVDDQEGPISCPGSTLAPGESMTCNANGTVQPGQYANMGSVTATLPDTAPVADTDPSHHFGQALLLEKSTEGEDADAPPGPVLSPGDTVHWSYEVTNPGPATVTGVSVTDDQGVVVTCPQTTLDAGESVTCTGSGTVQLGQYVNLGTATAVLPLGGVVSASDFSHYVGNLLGLQKATNGVDADTPPGPALVIGDPVTWTYEVTNFSGETLTGIMVTDDQGVTVTCPASELPAGESMTCTAGGTVQAGQYANLGTAEGTISLGLLTATDSSHYFGEEPVPSLSATKTAALTGDVAGDGLVGSGDTLTYTVVLVNSGTGAATGVVFTDAPDANTSLVVPSVTTTEGSVTTGNTAGDGSVEVAVGTLPPGGGTATITFQVTVDSPLAPGVTEIVNQGLVSGDGIAGVATDDPEEPGAADPTVVAVGEAAYVIPTLGTWATLLLLGLLAALGVMKLSGPR